jgi:hypothetical protein
MEKLDIYKKMSKNPSKVWIKYVYFNAETKIDRHNLDILVCICLTDLGQFLEEEIMDKLIALGKPFIESFLSLYIYSTLLGVLLGAYITYKLTIGRDRITAADDAYKTFYSSFFVKLYTIKANIEVKKKECGKRNFKKLNKKSRKYKNISLIARQILDVSDDMLEIVNNYDQNKFSMVVISRYFAVEQIKEQIRITETSILGFREERKFKDSRIARLNYELACAKISFVQAILEDMQKISKVARIKDKETKETIKFILKTCRAAKKKEVLKMNAIEESREVKVFNEKNIQVV